MENKFKKYKTVKFKKLAEKENKLIGMKLRTLRNLLVLQPEVMSQVLTITTNTIKNAENGLNVGSEVIGELIAFYGYDHKNFYTLTEYPTWQVLMKQVENHHKSIKSKAYLVLYERPNLIDLIEHRLLNIELFDNWVDEKAVLGYCETAFQYQYGSGVNSLNNAVKKGWLVRDDKSKPKRYRKKR